jgi:CRISP-associated protein Cas1
MSTLYITTQGATLQKISGQFIVYKQKDVLQNVPETLVKQIILVGNINLTTPTVSFCLEKQIEVVFLSQGGRFRGRLNGEQSRSVEVRRKQYERALDAQFCLRQAKAFVAGKIQNQTAIVRQQIKNGKLPADFGNLQNLLRKANQTESVESLLGIEGSASATYFRMFRALVPKPFSFPKRTTNPPLDEVNALLSLSYTLLYNRIATSLNMVGLDAYLGFFHKAQNGHAALASDLVEEFRPVIADALVLRLLNLKQLKITDFSHENGKIHLTDAGKKVFFSEFENKLASKRQTDAGDKWNLSYTKIIERQVHQLTRVINGEEAQYKPFILK